MLRILESIQTASLAAKLRQLPSPPLWFGNRFLRRLWFCVLASARTDSILPPIGSTDGYSTSAMRSGKIFSHLVGRVCEATSKTTIMSSHGGTALKPRMTSQTATGAAICLMGVQNGRLRRSMEMRVRAETNSTLMVDSTMPVKLIPAVDSSQEYGVGIHASAEAGSLLVFTPEAHVPHLDAHTGLWTRYDLSPDASLVSVQLADLKNQVARPPSVGGRYTSRTRVHHTSSTSINRAPGADLLWSDDGYRASESLDFISESCSLPSVSSCGLPFTAEPSWSCDWTFGRRFKGIKMGTPTTNVVASVITAGRRAASVAARLHGLQDGSSTHNAIGLYGDVHVAVEEIQLASGDIMVTRIGAEHREDMHRMLHHALLPLETELGVVPYARSIRAARTATNLNAPFHMPPFIVPPSEAEMLNDVDSLTKSLHVQHFDRRW